jgi:hypothetical protein
MIEADVVLEKERERWSEWQTKLKSNSTTQKESPERASKPMNLQCVRLSFSVKWLSFCSVFLRERNTSYPRMTCCSFHFSFFDSREQVSLAVCQTTRHLPSLQVPLNHRNERARSRRLEKMRRRWRWWQWWSWKSLWEKKSNRDKLEEWNSKEDEKPKTIWSIKLVSQRCVHSPKKLCFSAASFVQKGNHRFWETERRMSWK